MTPKWPLYLLILLVGEFISLKSSGQSMYFQPKFENFTTEHGIPSSEVYNIHQDSKGYMWFSTDNGISKYDGYTFKNYSTKDGLSDNTIFEIVEDSKNRLWFRSFSGRLSYFENDSIYNLPINDTLSKLLNGRLVTSIYVDSVDNISIGTMGSKVEDNFTCLTIKNDLSIETTDLRHLNDSSSCSFSYIKEIDENGFIYGAFSVLRKDEPVVFSNEKNIEHVEDINTYVHPDMTRKWGAGNRRAIKLDDDRFALAYDNMLVLFEENNIIDTLNLNGANFIYCIEYIDDKLWLGTLLGDVLVYEINNGLNLKQTLHIGYPVSGLHKDENGGFWVSTISKGVFYTPSLEVLSAHHLKGFPRTMVTGITSSDIEGVVAVYSGKMVQSIKQNEYKYYELNSERKENKEAVKPYTFNGGRIIIAGDYHGYHIIDNAEMTYYTGIRHGGNHLSFAKGGNNEEFWFGNHIRLFQVEKNQLKYDSNDEGFQARIISLAKGNNTDLWLGTSNGLWRFDQDKYYSQNNKHPFYKGKIKALLFEDDHLIAGVESEGIVINDGGNFKTITEIDGLISNNITQLITYNNDIWVATNKGISQVTNYKSDNNKVYSYTTKDGLPSNEVTGICFYEDTLWLSTTNGLSKFKPYKQLDNDLFFPLYVNAVQINDKNVELEKQYDLGFSENYISIDFKALFYSSIQSIKYQYKMEGIDDKWIETEHPKIRYSSIAPGNYTLKIRAFNQDDEQSNNVSIGFNIAKPWWKTWYFYLGVFGVVVSLIFLLAFIRVKSIKKNYKINTQIMVLEKQALQAQMNPHFIFNSLNSIQSFISSKDTKNSEMYLATFSRLMRLVLDSSRESEISLGKEIEALECYMSLEQLRCQNKFKYSFHVDCEGDEYFIMIPPMLIQPFVENAIIHGILNKEDQGEIKLYFKCSMNNIKVIIEDNGIGRAAASDLKKENGESHKSYGVLISNERLNILNKETNNNLTIYTEDLMNESGEPDGTKITLLIPIRE